jgi:hypothetical protein
MVRSPLVAAASRASAGAGPYRDPSRAHLGEGDRDDDGCQDSGGTRQQRGVVLVAYARREPQRTGGAVGDVALCATPPRPTSTTAEVMRPPEIRRAGHRRAPLPYRSP